MNRAAKAIGLAILFDSLDGRLARMTGTTTEFGVQFDSLADVVSFGIAPSILAYAWGFRSVTSMAGEGLHQLGQFAWVCCLAFLICCAWRLARFNVQGMAPGSSKYFVGMPTPAAAAVIAAVVHGLRLGGPMSIGPLQNGWWAIGWFILTAALGGLMTSTIRFYSFKDIPWARKQTSLAIVLVCLLAGVIWRYSEYTLMIIACTYTLVGVTLHLIRFFRHRLVSRTA
jgi:CDP-diacylglycerol--serine O-phosphatidyltransferase